MEKLIQILMRSKLILSWNIFYIRDANYISVPRQPDPCTPSPCGPNAICQKQGTTAVCVCPPGLLGDASSVSGCKPECVLSSDCPGDRACMNTKCVDPCLRNVCGFGAVCQAINHSPLCSCPQPTVGNPFVECHEVQSKFIDTTLS